MKDIVTIAVVSCAPVRHDAEAGRVSGFIRAAAKRGSDIVVFPSLGSAAAENAGSAAAACGVIAVCGISLGHTMLWTPDGCAVQAHSGWGTVDTAWGKIAFTDGSRLGRELPSGVRLAIAACDCQAEAEGDIKRLAEQGVFTVWANPSGSIADGWHTGGSGVLGPDGGQLIPCREGADTPVMQMFTIDLSEAERGSCIE